MRAEGIRPNVGTPLNFPSLSIASPAAPLRARARTPSSPPPSLRQLAFVAVCFLLVLSSRRRLSSAVPFDDLSLPPALFSSLSPDKRQHAALSQLPVVTSSALDVPNKSAVNTYNVSRGACVYSVYFPRINDDRRDNIRGRSLSGKLFSTCGDEESRRDATITVREIPRERPVLLCVVCRAVASIPPSFLRQHLRDESETEAGEGARRGSTRGREMEREGANERKDSSGLLSRS